MSNHQYLVKIWILKSLIFGVTFFSLLQWPLCKDRSEHNQWRWNCWFSSDENKKEGNRRIVFYCIRINISFKNKLCLSVSKVHNVSNCMLKNNYFEAYSCPDPFHFCCWIQMCIFMSWSQWWALMSILQTLNPQWNEEFVFRVSHFRLYYCILDVESDANRFSVCRTGSLVLFPVMI